MCRRTFPLFGNAVEHAYHKGDDLLVGLGLLGGERGQMLGTRVPTVDVFQRAKTSGAEMIKKKTGAGFAVGVSIAEVIHAIALDRKRVLPVSTVLTGAYGLRNVAISVPTVVGRRGAEQIIEIDLWPKELQALKRSASVLQETVAATKFG